MINYGDMFTPGMQPLEYLDGCWLASRRQSHLPQFNFTFQCNQVFAVARANIIGFTVNENVSLTYETVSITWSRSLRGPSLGN